MLLGKTARQVRYLLAHKQLQARKVDGRWVIDRASLPLSEAQVEARARRTAALRHTVEETLGAGVKEERKERYSVRDVKAFQLARPVHAALRAMTPPPTGLSHIHRALVLLAQGCHRFGRDEKALSYRAARDAVAEGLCELLLDGGEGLGAQATVLEQEVLPAIAGLIRRVEPRASR